MKRHHYGILIVTLLLLGVLAGYSFFKNGFMPVAWVNGEVLFSNEIESNALISAKLYRQAPNLVSEDEELAALFATGDPEEIYTRAFESAITAAIVRTSATEQARKRAEALSFDALKSVDVETFNTLLSDQYNWSVDTFAERIVEPQMLRQVLVEEHGDGFSVWMNDARKNATVKVWFVPFTWQNGELRQK